MSLRTTIPLTLVTSSVAAATPATDSGVLQKFIDGAQQLLARLVVGPLVSRSLHNQDALFENQNLASRHGEILMETALLRTAYQALEPVESRHFELVYLAEGADLYTEGCAWAVHYPPHACILVSRNTRIALGRVSPALRTRLGQWAETR